MFIQIHCSYAVLNHKIFCNYLQLPLTMPCVSNIRSPSKVYGICELLQNNADLISEIVNQGYDTKILIAKQSELVCYFLLAIGDPYSKWWSPKWAGNSVVLYI